MSKISTLTLSIVLAGLFSANAMAVNSGTPATQGTTTPGATSSTPPSPNAISMTDNCAGGGTRSVTGSYDAASGSLDLTIALSACVLRNGQTHDGTTTMKGTLLATTTGHTIDLVSNINTTVTNVDGSKLTRTCDITKKGSFTQATQTFDGTETRNNCTVTGKVREHENLVEHLLRNVTQSEESGGEDTQQHTLPKGHAGEQD